MTKDEIIEIGMFVELCDEDGEINFQYDYLKEILEFAKIIAKKERKECIEAIRWKLGRGKRDEYYQAQKDMILLLEVAKRCWHAVRPIDIALLAFGNGALADREARALAIP